MRSLLRVLTAGVVAGVFAGSCLGSTARIGIGCAIARGSYDDGGVFTDGVVSDGSKVGLAILSDVTSNGTSRWAVRAGLRYEQRGGRSKLERLDREEDIIWTLDYVSLPVAAVFRPVLGLRGISLSAGIDLGLLVAAMATTDAGEQRIKSDARDYEVSWLVGTEVSWEVSGHAAFVSAEYRHGLRDVLDVPDAVVDARFENRTVSVCGGIVIPLGW